MALHYWKCEPDLDVELVSQEKGCEVHVGYIFQTDNDLYRDIIFGLKHLFASDVWIPSVLLGIDCKIKQSLTYARYFRPGITPCASRPFNETLRLSSITHPGMIPRMEVYKLIKHFPDAAFVGISIDHV